MQIKVKDTRMHKAVNDKFIQKEGVLVVEGKLVLVKVLPDRDGVNPQDVLLGIHLNNPIIISETKKIEVDDYIMDVRIGHYGRIYKCLHIQQTELIIWIRTSQGGLLQQEKQAVKVLVLPEQFSPKHLQDIVDGKIKNKDNVLVECEFIANPPDESGNRLHGEKSTVKFIKLNSQGHVTLHMK